MPSGRVFSEHVFDSYSNLRDFFVQSDAIDQVLSRKDISYSRPLLPYKPNLAFQWKVCQVASAPFRYVLAFVLKIISKISAVAGAKDFAKQTKNCVRYQIAGFNVYSEEPTKLFQIKAARNDPNQEGKLVNQTPFIPESHITDPKVKKRTFCSLHQGVKFNHDQGICRGMRNWFLYLYLKTKNQFSDPRCHMSALGRQFAKGGGSEATLLQSIFLNKGKLLGLKVGTQLPGTHAAQTSLLKYDTSAWRSSAHQHIIDALQNMSVGAYSIHLPQHAVAYVKINNILGYFFDPNDGVIEVNGSAQGEKLYELLAASLRVSGGDSKVSAANFVALDPVTLRNIA